MRTTLPAGARRESQGAGIQCGDCLPKLKIGIETGVEGGFFDVNVFYHWFIDEVAPIDVEQLEKEVRLEKQYG